MKRRFVSILMALVMALSLLPAQALAEDTNVTKLTSTSGDLGSGVYRLDADVTITSTLNNTGDATVDLNGYVLRYDEAANPGSIFRVEAGKTLTLTDSRPAATHEDAKLPAGGLITGGKGYRHDGGGGGYHNYYYYGGGVYVGSGASFELAGGTIYACGIQSGANYAYGGGIYADGGSVTMTGGSIVGCIAITTKDLACGGGIRSEGNTTLSGTAEIRDCHAKGAGNGSYSLYGGGISDGHTNGKLSISDNVQIIGCTAGGFRSDAMYIIDGENRSISGGTFYGSINSTKNISGLTVTYQLNNENYATQVVPPDDTTSIPDPDKPKHTFSGWYKDGTLWDSSTPVTESLTLTGWLYKEVGTESDLTNALNHKDVETIRLTDNIKLSDVLEIAADRKVVLDLNGYVLDLGKKYISLAYDSINHRYANKQLTIVDSDPTKEHKFTDNDGLWVLDANGDKIVKGGVITGGSSTTNGGGVYIETNGTVIMNGGNIVGCTAKDGGAVCVKGGAFEMNGGAIIGCKAANGGGVYVFSGAFTMTDGSIENCTATNGSALYLKGTMYANGGTVSGTVVLDADNAPESSIQSLRNNNATTQFNGDVTNGNMISHGTFNGTVENTGKLTGGTYNDLIINKSANTKFNGVHSPLGIAGEKPGGSNTYYKVTFAPAEGDMDYQERYFLKDGNISGQIKPTRTGYTFGGWYNGKTKWDHTTDTVTEDMTLTAHWTGNTYTVTLDPNGGTVNPATITATYGAALPTMPVPVYPGYALTGWYDTQTGGRCYGDKTGASASSYDKTENCTLYAQWMSCDHSGSRAKPTCTADATCTVCGGTIEKLPHDFTAETVNAKYLKSAATCTEKAVYYKSCAVCGLSSKGTADEATFFSGNVLGHDWGDWTPSSNKTHTRTCKTDSTHTETKNCADDNKDHVCDTCGATLTQHSGGTASCTAPATCGYCGKPYGEKNPANHSDLKHVPAKAATTQAEGNSEYWLCSGCGKCYKDAAAATEIALSDTVIAKRIPRRYSGPTITVMGAAYYDGGNVGLTFVSSADFDTFTGVQVDGKTLAAKNYIAERGSIEVYLKAVYLRTLKNGSHTVTIQSTAGDVSAVFTVENSKTSPGTSDPGVAVYALSSMLSLTGLAALRRRKED